MVRQPVHLGGLGLRSMVETSLAAFIGAVEMALPAFVGDNGICPLLEDIIEAEASGEEARWRSLISSGCKVGEEYARAWDLLQTESRECSEYLGWDFIGHLAVENAGEGSSDGGTRRKVVEQKEGLCAAVLSKALELHPDQLARPVWIFPQLDKMSSSWILTLPGPNTGLTSPIFSEALAAHLCIPSPACMQRLGESIGPGMGTACGSFLGFSGGSQALWGFMEVKAQLCQNHH